MTRRDPRARSRRLRDEGPRRPAHGGDRRKAKQIQVTEADIEKGYDELAEQTGKNVAKMKAEYRDPKKREMLIGMILEDKILDLVEGAAKVTEA